MSPLENYPQIRNLLYIAQWIANLVMGVLGIVFLNDRAEGVPQNFTLAGLVLAFVWTYTGVQASANTTTTRPRDQRGAGLLEVALTTLVVLVVVVLALQIVGVL